MTRQELEALLPPDSLFSGKLLVEERVDSTNTRLKLLAAQGAPAGTALLAQEQTGGRGTHGRGFQSPRGDGLYLSVLLRPKAPLSDLLSLTGWAAAAVRAGIEKASGAPCAIKWLNDIFLNGRKLVGILTELSLQEGEAGPDWVVVGVGVNVHQSAQTFRAQGLERIAASLDGEGYPVRRAELAAALLGELDRLERSFPREKGPWLDQYRKYCLTPGRRVSFEENGQALRGTARAVDDSFALLIDGEDGALHRVFSGTVRME